MSWSCVFEDKSNFKKERGNRGAIPDLGHQIKSGLQGNQGSRTNVVSLRKFWVKERKKPIKKRVGALEGDVSPSGITEDF